MSHSNHIRLLEDRLENLAGLQAALTELWRVSEDEPVETSAVEAVITSIGEGIQDAADSVNALSMALSSDTRPTDMLLATLDALRAARQRGDAELIAEAERELTHAPVNCHWDALHKIYGLGAAPATIEEMDRHMFFAAMDALTTAGALNYHTAREVLLKKQTA